MYEIVFSVGAGDDLKRLRAYDRARVLDGIETQLAKSPDRETRNKKLIENIVPPFEATPPVWQLRIGDFRVYYDVNQEHGTVFVRAVRRKLPHRTTGETL